MQNLGHEIGRGTLAKVGQEAGVAPAPERERKTPWKEFLRAHGEVLAAADFCCVAVWMLAGMVRYQVRLVIRLARREVHLAGIIPEPQGSGRKPRARHLSDGLEGFLRGHGYLLHERARVFSEDCRMILQASGIESVRLPARSPYRNAIAERFVRRIKESCLDRLILTGEASLHRVIREFVVPDHRERNHPGLENKIMAPDFERPMIEGKEKRHNRLGGLLNYYHRKAA